MRVVGASALTTLQSGSVRSVAFVELQFTSGTQYLSNARGNFDWSGHTWVGIGKLIELKPIREVTTGEITGGEIVLSGGAPADIASALTESVQGRPAAIYQAVLDEAMQIQDVIAETWCRMDRYRIVHGKQGVKLILSVESELAMARRPKTRRWTYEDQRQFYPADTGMRHLTRMKEFIIRFPTADAMRR